VLRGVQSYRGHLIAYSLGDFAGYENFATQGDLGMSVILHVTLSATGRFESGPHPGLRCRQGPVTAGSGRRFLASS
jgi:poly-gamma-glutamate capsule biosynthesis protein CapA/YwtB (metallophosphatase superfamily)